VVDKCEGHNMSGDCCKLSAIKWWSSGRGPGGGRVDAAHPELATDPFGILRPPSKLQHPLPLVSAYTALTKQPCLESEAGPPPPPPYTTPVLNPHCLCSQLRALTLCVQLCTCL